MDEKFCTFPGMTSLTRVQNFVTLQLRENWSKHHKLYAGLFFHKTLKIMAHTIKAVVSFWPQVSYNSFLPSKFIPFYRNKSE